MKKSFWLPSEKSTIGPSGKILPTSMNRYPVGDYVKSKMLNFCTICGLQSFNVVNDENVSKTLSKNECCCFIAYETVASVT